MVRVKTLITFDELRIQRLQWLREGKRIGFVPTMGALHAGHLSLVRLAKQQASLTFVSIFVNPAQFGVNEDFAKYPRALKEDMEKLTGENVDIVFLPTAAEIYPENFQTYVINQKAAHVLCGKSRPGHFQGVLTVVLKFFNLLQPDVAVFGKKDFQQWKLIEMMARDLNLSTRIVGGEIVREADGLAMSSRNRYLSAEEREAAPAIHKNLKAVQELFSQGERKSKVLIEKFAAGLKQASSLFKIDYHEIVRQADLEILSDGEIQSPAQFCVAVWMGKTRLIDNIELSL